MDTLTEKRKSEINSWNQTKHSPQFLLYLFFLLSCYRQNLIAVV